MEACAVMLLDRAQPGEPQAGTRVLRPTPQQRTSQPLPVGEIRLMESPQTLRLPPGARSSLSLSLSLYRAATPRLERREQAGGAPQGTFFFLSFVNGLPGHEQEYDRWYLEHHIHEVLAAPDFVAAQRFTLERALVQDLLPPFRFMAVYELRSDDLARSIAALESYLASGVMTETPFKDPSRRLQLFAQAPEFASIV